jgi:hypothetical protein
MIDRFVGRRGRLDGGARRIGSLSRGARVMLLGTLLELLQARSLSWGRGSGRRTDWE